ncbi:MAG TPA: hypothetical protein EYQ50_23100 [Verrucomicrobiales bacterium]|nr:hypothetical protein [Verrucomicrobiales bacterium]
MSRRVFSGELDKLLAACRMKVFMFFTFWATGALKKSGWQAKNKTFAERMFGWMLPGGFNKQKL